MAHILLVDIGSARFGFPETDLLEDHVLDCYGHFPSPLPPTRYDAAIVEPFGIDNFRECYDQLQRLHVPLIISTTFTQREIESHFNLFAGVDYVAFCSKPYSVAKVLFPALERALSEQK